MIAHDYDATQICADQLTEGDIIRLFTGDVWQVIPETEYVSNGISFEGERGGGCLRISNHLVEVLCLDVETPPNTQQVIFAAGWRFELLDYQPLITA